VTSREVLNVPGEISRRVPSLSAPGIQAGTADLTSYEAVRLFIERAAAVEPCFVVNDNNARALAEVCRRLDGIPLAIELAAVRVQLLSIQDIAQRLDNCFRLLSVGNRTAAPRHRTLRAAIDWSYDLLDASEQALFERLSVFNGAWTLDAAETVCSGGVVARDEVLDLAWNLVRKSLVLAEPVADGTYRYRLLGTLRQYAQEHLDSNSGATQWPARHAEYFVTLAEGLEAHFRGEGEAQALRRFEEEHDNFRAALVWLMDNCDLAGAQRLGAALARFWFYRGYPGEGRARIDALLALDGTRKTPARAKLLYGEGLIAMSVGEYAVALQASRGAAALWRRLGNNGETAAALSSVGLVANLQGDYAAAQLAFEDGAGLARGAGDKASEAQNLFLHADTLLDLLDDGRARLKAEAALALAKEVGFTRAIAQAQRILGEVSLRQQQFQAARSLMESSLQTLRTLGGQWWVAWTLTRLGQLAIQEHDLPRAGSVLAESLRLARDLNDRQGVARALEACSELAAVGRRPVQALRFAGAASSVRETIGAPLAPAQHEFLEWRLVAVRSRLAEERASSAWATGAALGPEQAIADALAECARGATTPSPLTKLRRGDQAQPLTQRELDVAALVAEGLTNAQIAQRLSVSERTVETHVSHALAKLELSTRTSLTAWAIENGLHCCITSAQPV
jgi:non-specific serine/threonine protein kinase